MRPAPLSAAIAALLAGALAGEALSAPVVPPPVGANTIALHQINVDQGAAALLETPCGTIMIDAGGREGLGDQHLMDYLDAYFSARPALGKRLAAIFITHTHIDHDVALNEVAAAYGVGGFIYDGRDRGDVRGFTRKMLIFADAQSPKIPVEKIDDRLFGPRGNTPYSNSTVDPLACPGTDPKIALLSGGMTTRPTGWTQDDFENPNNHSLVIRVDYGKASFLFLGDSETAAQRTLVAKYAASKRLDVDVILVPHHGADNGVTKELATATKPAVALISSGDPSSRDMWTAFDHGHPRVTSLSRLQPYVIRARAAAADEPAFNGQETEPVAFTVTKAIYDTAWDGDIVVTAKADGTIDVVGNNAPPATVAASGGTGGRH